MTQPFDQLFNIGFFVTLIGLASCQPEEYTHPCEDVECENGGICINGSCLCEDGYEGDRCQSFKMPEAAWLTGIELSAYPTFEGDTPWDGDIGVPACWPDYAIGVVWPWGQVTQSYARVNANGNPLFWNESVFPYLDQHIHSGDSLILSVVEVDGFDSLETVQPAEELLSIPIYLDHFLLVDSMNPWPGTTIHASDSLDLMVRCSWVFEFDH